MHETKLIGNTRSTDGNIRKKYRINYKFREIYVHGEV